MLRGTRNCASPEWLAIYIRWDAVTKQLQTLDATLLRRRLSDFVLPRDHFLPLQILAHSIEAVSRLSFEDLRRFPGVGQVKIRNLLGVIDRILRSPREISDGISEAGDRALRADDEVTEAVWSRWRADLRDCASLREPIGRHLDRLSELPRGSWFVPAEEFVALSLKELHDLRGFGAKRVGAIVATVRQLRSRQVFAESYPGIVATYQCDDIARAEAWLVTSLCMPEFATLSELQSEVVAALRNRVQYDLGLAHAELKPASDGKERSRSRLHQMRRDVADTMRVRWPRGELLVAAFLRHIATVWDACHVAAAAQSLAPYFPSLRADHRTRASE